MNKIMKFITPKSFLIIGGILLLLIGILGFIGVIGPTPQQSIFGSFWWFDNAENVAHTFLGIVGLLAAFVLPSMWQRYLVYVLAALGFFFGVYSLFMTQFGPANLQNPPDTILHLVVGVLALWFAMSGSNMEPKKM